MLLWKPLLLKNVVVDALSVQSELTEDGGTNPEGGKELKEGQEPARGLLPASGRVWGFPLWGLSPQKRRAAGR